MKKIRIKARKKGEIIEVKSLFNHIMETGRRIDKATGALIPAHYITEVAAHHNNELVLEAYFGPGVSKNPYMEFKIIGGASGDTVSLSYVDNLGETGETNTTIK